jgi:ATP-binding cassette subfamily C (CFTR/MRP) protein 1
MFVLETKTASDDKRSAEVLSRKLDESWAKRVAAAAEYNTRLKAGEIKPSIFKRVGWAVKSTLGKSDQKALETRWREKDGLREASLAWALNDVFGTDFWCGGLFKVRCVCVLVTVCGS